jgi:hypothetical protein
MVASCFHHPSFASKNIDSKVHLFALGLLLLEIHMVIWLQLISEMVRDCLFYHAIFFIFTCCNSQLSKCMLFAYQMFINIAQNFIS